MSDETKQAMEEGEEGLDPVRRLVLRLSREKRLPLNLLSRSIGYNSAYLHQYIYRGSPKELAERARRKLAEHLGIDEAALRLDAEGTPVAPPPPQAHISTPSVTWPGRDVPVLRLGDRVDAPPAEWAPRPPPLAAVTSAFALWVPDAAGRLRPGDLAYVHPTQPPRTGDTVVLLDNDRLLDVGELSLFDVFTGSHGERRLDRTTMRVCKVVCLVLP